MPIYGFKCLYCDWEGEIYRHNYESMETTECPACGKEAIRDWKSVGGPELFTPYFTEAFGAETPLRVETKKQEKELERKTGTRRIN